MLRLKEEERELNRQLAIQRKRLREKKNWKKIKTKFQKAAQEASRLMKAAEQEKIDEYVEYYTNYHKMEEAAKEITDPQIRLKWDKVRKKIKLKWPNPYNRCDFTEFEFILFRLYPYQSWFWKSLLTAQR